MDPEPERLQELEDSNPESLPDLEDQFTTTPFQGPLTLEQIMWINELEDEMHNNLLEVEVADRNNECTSTKLYPCNKKCNTCLH